MPFRELEEVMSTPQYVVDDDDWVAHLDDEGRVTEQRSASKLVNEENFKNVLGDPPPRITMAVKVKVKQQISLVRKEIETLNLFNFVYSSLPPGDEDDELMRDLNITMEMLYDIESDLFLMDQQAFLKQKVDYLYINELISPSATERTSSTKKILHKASPSDVSINLTDLHKVVNRVSRAGGGQLSINASHQSLSGSEVSRGDSFVSSEHSELSIGSSTSIESLGPQQSADEDDDETLPYTQKQFYSLRYLMDDMTKAMEKWEREVDQLWINNDMNVKFLESRKRRLERLLRDAERSIVEMTDVDCTTGVDRRPFLRGLQQMEVWLNRELNTASIATPRLKKRTEETKARLDQFQRECQGVSTGELAEVKYFLSWAGEQAAAFNAMIDKSKQQYRDVGEKKMIRYFELKDEAEVNEKRTELLKKRKARINTVAANTMAEIGMFRQMQNETKDIQESVKDPASNSKKIGWRLLDTVLEYRPFFEQLKSKLDEEDRKEKGAKKATELTSGKIGDKTGTKKRPYSVHWRKEPPDLCPSSREKRVRLSKTGPIKRPDVPKTVTETERAKRQLERARKELKKIPDRQNLLDTQ